MVIILTFSDNFSFSLLSCFSAIFFFLVQVSIVRVFFRLIQVYFNIISIWNVDNLMIRHVMCKYASYQHAVWAILRYQSDWSSQKINHRTQEEILLYSTLTFICRISV